LAKLHTPMRPHAIAAFSPPYVAVQLSLCFVVGKRNGLIA
jgi:hypothetical protein